MPQARLPESSGGSYIRYYTNGGEALADYEIGNSSTVTLTAEMLPALEKDGYYFAGWYTTVDFRNGTKVEEGDTVSLADNYLHLYAKWMQGIPGQISRITNAVNDIKAAIEEKGGTVPEDAQVDDLADIIRNMSTPQQNLVLPCTLTNYEHYYAVGSHSVSVNGGSMAVSETQTPYVVGYYNRGSSNKYSAVMVTAPDQAISGTIKSITLRLTVTTNNNNAVYVGKVTDTSDLTNTGGTPWYTGKNTGYILKDITDLGYTAGCSYSLIQDSNSTSSVDIVVTGAALIIETE